jgi:hypothetical protein
MEQLLFLLTFKVWSTIMEESAQVQLLSWLKAIAFLFEILLEIGNAI